MKETTKDTLANSLELYSEANNAMIKAIEETINDLTNISDTDPSVSSVVWLDEWIFQDDMDEEPIRGIGISHSGEVFAVTKNTELDLSDLTGDILFEITNTLLQEKGDEVND
jgi:hypothetical protein